MVSCLLCLEKYDDSRDSIKTDSKRWQELNIAEILEKYFWPLNTNQLSSCICLSCWQIVQDFHEFYSRIEQAHMKFNVIKVEKEEIMETNFQETEITIDQKVPHHLTQQEIQYSGCTNTSLAENTENNKVADLADEHTSSGNIRENYESDTDTSDDDDDEETVMDKKKNSDAGLKYHQCITCDIFYKEEYLLRLHKSIHLPDEEKKFPCCDCTEIYESFYPLLQHLEDAHLMHVNACYVCGKSIFSRRAFESHINKHEGRPDVLIYCDICGKGLSTEKSLRRHQKSQHPVDGKKDYQCPNCPKISPNLESIRRHINTMHDASVHHKCEICEKVFKRKLILKEHMAAHEGTPLYTCPWCPKMFYFSNTLQTHRKRLHKKEWEKVKLQKYSEDFQKIISSKSNKKKIKDL